ncbi:MAG: beta-L-arabinofuranosidase domain-containing protein [Terriglobales bacterium]
MTSRRSFLQSLGAAGAGGAVSSSAWAGPWASVGHRSTAAASAMAKVQPRLRTVAYAQVRLTDGPARTQYEAVCKAYLGLNEDGLLHGYRQRAGLPAPGEAMGGWYGPQGFCPGHSFGQYVSGLARMANAQPPGTPNPYRDKVQRLVAGWAATLGSDNMPYMNPRAAQAFPAYVFDKNMVGLLDAWRYAGINTRELVQRNLAGARPFLEGRALEWGELPAASPYDETYTLPENLWYASAMTGEPEYAALARQYLFNRQYFDPLVRGENPLPGKHAYSHYNCLSSAARTYYATGEARYLDAALHGFELVRQQQFASGGWGPNEQFVTPGKGLLGDSLTTTQAHFETPCGSYASFKLARYLQQRQGEAKFGDHLERVFYNTILGARVVQPDGHGFYYSSYHPMAVKSNHPDPWTCCSGTLPQVVSDYLISSYYLDGDGVYVNLYLPSELRWKTSAGLSVRLTQETRFPESEEVVLRVSPEAPAEFPLSLRLPGWMAAPAQVRINGSEVAASTTPGSVLRLDRTWKTGDEVSLRLPMTWRQEPVDAQHPDLVALLHGPVMMVAVSQPPVLAAAPPALAAIPPRLLPFYAVTDEVYTTYLQRGRTL